MSTESPKPDQPSNKSAPTPNSSASQPSPAKQTSSGSSALRISLLVAILVALGVLAFVELRARHAYTETLTAWQNAIRESEKTPGADAVTLTAAELMIQGKPSVTSSAEDHFSRTITYSWPGLLKNYSIILTCSTAEPPEVLGLETAGAPPEPKPTQVAASADGTGEEPEDGTSRPSGMGGGGPGGGPAAPGGGGGGFSEFPTFESIDGNTDGKLTPDEFPKPIRDGFANVDENGDGSVDEAEWNTYRDGVLARAREQRKYASGGGGGGGGRGGQRRSFEDLDKNKDGKISQDEAPERMKQFFGRMDANSDGSIDKAEWEAAQERRRNRGGREGQGGQQGRPQPPARPTEAGNAKPAAEPQKDDSKPKDAAPSGAPAAGEKSSSNSESSSPASAEAKPPE